MNKCLPAALVLLIALPATILALDIPGSGRLRTQTRQAQAFQSVQMSSVGYLRISRGPAPSLKVTLDDNLLEYYESRVSDGVLSLGFSPGVTVRNPTRLVVDITMPRLERLELSGACAADIEPGFSGQRLELEVSGAGRIGARLEVKSLGLKLSGSGSMVLAGSAEDMAATITGAGGIEAADLKARRVKAELSGAGRLAIRAVDSLDLSASGACDVVYWGNPSLSQRISGPSRVRRSGP